MKFAIAYIIYWLLALAVFAAGVAHAEPPDFTPPIGVGHCSPAHSLFGVCADYGTIECPTGYVFSDERWTNCIRDPMTFAPVVVTRHKQSEGSPGPIVNWYSPAPQGITSEIKSYGTTGCIDHEPDGKPLPPGYCWVGDTPGNMFTDTRPDAMLDGQNWPPLPQPPSADHSWHVLVVTKDGKVSLLKGLTKFEAEHTAAKLQGQAYTREEKAAEKKFQEEQRAADAAAWKEMKAQVLAAKAACPVDDPVSRQGSQAFEKKYPTLSGCVQPDGTVRRMFIEYQLSSGWGGFEYAYRQVEVFQ